MAHHPDLAYWLALRRAGLGSTNFALLLARFRSIAEAWKASPRDLREAGLDAQYARAVEKARQSFNGDRELAAVERYDARVYTWLDEDFPARLR